MSSVPLRFVRIRLFQVGRELRYAGLLRGGVLIVLFFILLFLFGFSQLQYPSAWIGGGILAFVVLMVHRYRTDRSVVNAASTVPWKVFTAEYLFFASPFLITGLVLAFPVALVLIPVLTGISLLPGRKVEKVVPGRFSVMIPANAFEWRAGFRKNKWSIVTLYFLAMMLTPFPYATLIFLWLLSGVICSFYIPNEGREMIEAPGLGPAAFLKNKIISHLQLAGIIFLVPLVIHLVFQQHEWIPVLIFVVLMSLNIALYVVSKYAIWKPGGVGSVNEMIFSMAVISIVIPFLLPLPFFFLVRNTIRSKKNLKPWLHDFNPRT